MLRGVSYLMELLDDHLSWLALAVMNCCGIDLEGFSFFATVHPLVNKNISEYTVRSLIQLHIF